MRRLRRHQLRLPGQRLPHPERQARERSDAPANPAASFVGNGINVSWKANTEANLAGYNIYRSDTETGTFTKLNTTGVVSTNSYLDTAAPLNATSYYRIAAVDLNGTESGYATANAFRGNDTTPPVAPAGLTATGSVANITLNWTANTELDLAGYNVYRATSSAGVYTKLNTSGLLTASSYVDTTAAAGATSYYRVTAVDTTGNESTASTTAGTRSNPDTTPPAAPTGLVSTGTTAGIALDWANNGESDLAGYNVYRAVTSGGTYTKLNSSLLLASDFNDTTAAAGLTSYYRVTAVDTSGNESTAATTNMLRPGSPQSPFNGSPFAVGSTPITLQGEDYDLGGENVSYHDTDPENLGGAYRNDAVDIRSITGSTTEYRISDVAAGEWLEYTITVATAGTYTADFRVACPDPGATFHLEANGVNITGSISVPSTGGADAYTTITKNVTLGAGTQVLKLVFDSVGTGGVGASFDSMRLSQASATQNVTVPSLAAAYVRDGSYATRNFGTDTSLVVKQSPNAGNTRTSYLKFDLSNVSGTISSAKVRVYGKLSASGSVPISIKSTDASWVESSITFNSAPAAPDRPWPRRMSIPPPPSGMSSTSPLSCRASRRRAVRSSRSSLKRRPRAIRRSASTPMKPVPTNRNSRLSQATSRSSKAWWCRRPPSAFQRTARTRSA